MTSVLVLRDTLWDRGSEPNGFFWINFFNWNDHFGIAYFTNRIIASRGRTLGWLAKDSISKSAHVRVGLDYVAVVVFGNPLPEGRHFTWDAALRHGHSLA